MKFGIFSMTHAPVDVPHAETYETFHQIVDAAERLGFWSIWTTEHHFRSKEEYRPFGAADYTRPAEYDISPDPFTLLAYSAARTKNLRLGTAVAVLPWDHPIRLVERAAMVDVLSGGRMELGIGRGSQTREGPVFGVPAEPEAAARRFYESIDVIRKAWSGDPFTHEGEFYQLPPNLALTPRPIQRTAPLWLGSASDDSARWAGRNGLPYATIAWPLMIMEEYARKRDIYLAAAAEAGQDVSDNENVVLLYCYCGESDEEATETAYKHMRQFQFINEQHYEMLADEERFRPFREAMGFASPEDWVHGNAMYTAENHLVGSVDTVIERLKFHEEERGLRYVLMNHGWGLMPLEKSVASMQRIAEHVMPHFTGPHANQLAGQVA
jgi:alkanesulfonate monooxygenase SsuD/methylene tetrahydromethanopterin reductase-like flavin-dependent oxidoreductase (luciferase family)